MLLDIGHLHDGWMELESDPGLFTLLLEDFGVSGLQVEEIYDVSKPVDEKTHGFILLFRWVEERRARQRQAAAERASAQLLREQDEISSIFFAQQVVPNSCATHALVSILLNCPDIELGATLTNLKHHTEGMCPENKGLAIGNTAELAWAHNRHAAPHAQRATHHLRLSSGCNSASAAGLGSMTSSTSVTSSAASAAMLTASSAAAANSMIASGYETFHFVSYVPIGGRLFELDGLKPAPIDHGGWCEDEQWTDKFRRVIADRLGIANSGRPYNSNEIRFSLMCVVSDRRVTLTQRLTALKADIWWLYGIMTGMDSEPGELSCELATRLGINTTGSDVCDASAANSARATVKHWDTDRLAAVIAELNSDAKQLEERLSDELEKRNKYKLDACRRRHDYDPFITTYLSLLADEGILGDMVQQQIYPKKIRAKQRPVKSTQIKSKKRKKIS